MAPLAGIVALIGGGLAKLLTVETLKFVAFRALIIGSLTLVLPVVLYNVFTRILQETMDICSANIASGGITGGMVELTGMAGWIAQQINLSGCFSIFLSAVALRFTLSFIRGG
jgi:hypothetical protein